MSVAILFGVIVAVIFAAAFVSSRRFGPLALALAAGFYWLNGGQVGWAVYWTALAWSWIGCRTA